MNSRITKIVFDGGPCGGKTSGMSLVQRELARIDIIALVVPEAATLLMTGGIVPRDIVAFQGTVAELQLLNEEIWTREALAMERALGKRVVLLCDRGVVGCAAYLPDDESLETFNYILAEVGTDVEQARARYEGVIHMVTAAEGAEEFYTTENNTVRIETPEMARQRDSRMIQAWTGHAHLAVVANVDQNGVKRTFEQKMRRTLAEVFRILGYPVPLEIERKYKLRSFDLRRIPVDAVAIDIDQTYLIPDDPEWEERVRARTWGGTRSYYHTTKKPAGNGARVEVEHIIDSGRYDELLRRADPRKLMIQKTRYYFVWHSQYFEVDVFKGRHEGLLLVECELTEQSDEVHLPPFLDVERDVTDDKAFKNASLAKA